MLANIRGAVLITTSQFASVPVWPSASRIEPLRCFILRWVTDAISASTVMRATM